MSLRIHIDNSGKKTTLLDNQNLTIFSKKVSDSSFRATSQNEIKVRQVIRFDFEYRQ